MSTPPNAHLFNREAVHVASVYKELVKSVKDLLADFHAMTAFGSLERDKSLVVASASTFERNAARCVSVHFVGAVAHVEFDSFSHGYKLTTKRAEVVDVTDIDVAPAVKAIITLMADIEPLFGSHVRDKDRGSRQDRRILVERMQSQSLPPTHD